MMGIIRDEEIPIELWQKLIVSNIHSSPFQTPEFYELCRTVPGLRPIATAIKRKDSLVSLAVVVIQQEKGFKYFFSGRGIIYGGPLIDHDYPEALGLLLTEISSALKGRVIYIESRNFTDYSNFSGIVQQYKWKYTPHLSLTLDVRDKSLHDTISGMNYNRRREIRLSLEKGAQYVECENEEELKDLYGILSELYRTRVRLPLPDFLFFKTLWLNKPGKVFVVKHGSRVIGGSFCLVQPAKGIYTMYYCGLRTYDKKIFPTHLAVLAACDYAIKNGLRTIDLMGAGKPGEKYGVRDYKAGFGGDLVENGRYIKIQKPLLYYMGRTTLSLMRLIRI